MCISQVYTDYAEYIKKNHYEKIQFMFNVINNTDKCSAINNQDIYVNATVNNQIISEFLVCLTLFVCYINSYVSHHSLMVFGFHLQCKKIKQNMCLNFWQVLFQLKKLC